MKFYIDFDEAGLIRSRYIDAIHGSAIPETAIEVVETIFNQTIQETDGEWILSPDQTIVKQSFAPVVVSIEDLKNQAMTTINASFDAVLAAGYMTTLSIKKDTKLADIYQLKTGFDLAVLLGETTMSIVDYDNVVHTALPLADIETIMGEVGANYRTQFFKKQQYRAAIAAATTPEAVAAVVWS